MDTKTMIRGVKYVAEKHKNDTKFTGQTVITDMCNDIIPKLEKLSAYENAEEEGRLVVLPCKVGDTLFVITPDSPIGIETTKCIRLSIDKRGIKIQAPAVHDDWGNAKWNFKPIDFGKKVFLDFEEAKKALKEMEVK